MKKNTRAPLWVAVVLDESGSMSGNRTETISGFNEFLQDRQKDAEDTQVRIWLTKFNTEQKALLSGEEVRNVRPMSTEDYNPNGMTALFDAVAATTYAIDAELQKLSREDQTPRIMVLIMTDGQENSSKEINEETLRNIIKNREKTDNWVFKYIGANVDAMLVAQRLGAKTKGRSTTNATYGSALRGMSNVVRATTYAPGDTLSKADTFVESTLSKYDSADSLANAVVDKDGNIKVD